MSHLDKENACFECGQCCQKLRVSFYHAEPVPVELTVKLTPHRACMKGTEDAQGCIALSHSPAQGYRCTIYADRPSPCREFNPIHEDGTPNSTCARLRMEAGLAPIVES